MDFSELREFIDEIASETQAEVDEVETQSIVPNRPEKRIALGWSRNTETQARMEIRVTREDGWARNRAEELKGQVKGEARIIVMERANISPKTKALSSKAVKGLAPSSPLCLGSSIGHTDGGPGSICGFANNKKGKLVALSCSHVLKPTESAVLGDPILHPGRGDMRRIVPSEHIVGTLEEHTVFAREQLNDADFAYARLDPNADTIGNIIPQKIAPAKLAGKSIERVGSPDQEMYYGLEVGKVGRTTGFTTGMINADQLVTGLPVMFYGVGNLLFGRVIEVRWDSLAKPFTMDGDSGSLVFSTDEAIGIGMHFAASAQGTDEETGEQMGLSYALALDKVLEDYDLKWLN